MQKVLINTALWVVLVPVVATAFGLVYATLVDRTRFEKAAKALIFLPMAISMVGASIIWRFVYEYRPTGANPIDPANQLPVWLGLDPYQFLITEPWSTLFLIIVIIWIQAGFAMTVLSAAIKAARTTSWRPLGNLHKDDEVDLMAVDVIDRVPQGIFI